MRFIRRRSAISADIARKQRQLNRIPIRAYRFFKSVTPIDSGNARRKTRLDNDTIIADYPYAQRLNQGWSRQARSGMVEPTLAYIRRLVRQIIGR